MDIFTPYAINNENLIIDIRISHCGCTVPWEALRIATQHASNKAGRTNEVGGIITSTSSAGIAPLTGYHIPDRCDRFYLVVSNFNFLQRTEKVSPGTAPPGRYARDIRGEAIATVAMIFP